MNAFRDLKGGLHFNSDVNNLHQPLLPYDEPGLSRLGKTPETDLQLPATYRLLGTVYFQHLIYLDPLGETL